MEFGPPVWPAIGFFPHRKWSVSSIEDIDRFYVHVLKPPFVGSLPLIGLFIRFLLLSATQKKLFDPVGAGVRKQASYPASRSSLCTQGRHRESEAWRSGDFSPRTGGSPHLSFRDKTAPENKINGGPQHSGLQIKGCGWPERTPSAKFGSDNFGFGLLARLEELTLMRRNFEIFRPHGRLRKLTPMNRGKQTPKFPWSLVCVSNLS